MSPLSPVTSLPPALALTRPDLGIRIRPAQPPTFTSWDISASGGATAGGNADLSLTEGIGGGGGATTAGSSDLALRITLAASGGAAAGGSAALALLLSLAASGGSAAGGSASLALFLALAASGSSNAGGRGDITRLTPTLWSLTASGAAQSAGTAELQVWTLGVSTVAVLVPRTNGSYALRSVITGIAYEYPVSPVDSGGGLVQIPPDELARFLRAVPGSIVQDPVQAELFRVLRPFVPQSAGPFRGE